MRGAEPRAALAAATFLTRLPLGRSVALEGADLARGALWFPLVGAAAGAAVGGTAYGLARVVPALVAAGLALALGALLTGGLHLDGLADTADALGSPKERALAIMRDHATGAFGTAAVALDLLVKAAALAALASRAYVVVVALAAGALSRWSAVALAWALPAARTDGAGAAFRVSAARTLLATAAAIALSFGELRLVPIAGVLAFGFALGFRRWLGGLTGDTLGAAVELTETALLAAATGFA
jgi:adenosylcobinamide-GDP ribazoletransferase